MQTVSADAPRKGNVDRNGETYRQSRDVITRRSPQGERG